MGHGDDLVPLAQAQSQQGGVQCCRALVYGYGIVASAVAGELLLQGLHLRAAHILTAAQDFPYAGLNLLTYLGVLLLEVDQGNRWGFSHQATF